MKAAKSNWLDRLSGSPEFFSLGEPPTSRVGWALGGLAAGAVPDAVRSSHGYAAQFPTDDPVAVREARPGDVFRVD